MILLKLEINWLTPIVKNYSDLTRCQMTKDAREIYQTGAEATILRGAHFKTAIRTLRGSQLAALGAKPAHKAVGKVGLCQTTQRKIIARIISYGEGYVLNFSLRVALVIPFIFIDIQRVELGCSTKVTVYASCRDVLLMAL